MEKDGDGLFRSIWKKQVGTVAGKAYALDEAARVACLTEAGLSYLEYDWSLNDSARSE